MSLELPELLRDDSAPRSRGEKKERSDGEGAELGPPAIGARSHRFFFLGRVPLLQ